MAGRRHAPVAVIAAVLAGAVTPVLHAGTAHAHGAPTDPVSRTALCGVGGVQRASAVCRAAETAGKGSTIGPWDNLRLPNAAGNDRAAVPDGQLCSAGLEAYRGLDTAGAQWPATTLEAGGPFTLTYRSSIPHRGTFTLYLTKPGHDPAAPLRWSDLDERPVAVATDPALEGGAYRITGRLPKEATGRHVLYTVWRNTDTPDTYYSCSDVLLVAGGADRQGRTRPGSPSGRQTGVPPADEAAGSATDGRDVPVESSAPAEPTASFSAAPAPGGTAGATPPVGRAAPAPAGSTGGERPMVLFGAGAAALALVSVCGSVALGRRSRNRPQAGPKG